MKFPKKYDLGRSQYQNKKALSTDPIFSEGFEPAYVIFTSFMRFWLVM